MKKLSLVAALLALAGSACGDDKKSDDKSDGGSNNGGENNGGENNGDGGANNGEDAGPGCDIEIEAYPDYEGDAVWTIEQQQACADACGMVPEAEAEACIEANCPDYEKFNDCINGTLINCLTNDDKDGDCRADWETYICCAENNCADASEAEAQACLDKNCQAQIDTVGECVAEEGDFGAAIPNPCIRKAVDRCIKESADAGTPMMSIASPNASQMILRMVKNHAASLRAVTR